MQLLTAKCGRIMRLTTIFLLAASLSVSATGRAQTITLSERNSSLEKVFKLIEKQTDYHFMYRDEWMTKANKINIDVKNGSLEQVLEFCFHNQPLSYSILDKLVVVKEKSSPLFPFTGISLITRIDIHGLVVNEKGDPVEGVTVTVKGTKNATATNTNGEFDIKGVEEKAVLVFSGTNVETNEIELNGKTDLLINLKTKVSALQDVVVNKGYYITSQRLNTGNVTTIKSAEIGKQPVSNPLQALQGRVPGMLIIQNTGMPGGSFSVQIRGKNSISAGNDPLYVIDGVPYTGTLLANFNPAGGGNPLNFINPSDIESIDVLKDADATAIYGSRGANGVVLITTKKGKAGKTRVDVNVYTGIGQVTRTVDWLNRQQYLQMRREALKNDNTIATPGNAPDLMLWDTTRYTNWQKLFIGGTAHYTDAEVSVSGGTMNTQYSISGGYHKETTVFPGDFSDQKASVHFSLSSTSENQKFRAVLSSSYVADNNNLLQEDLTSYSYLAPTAPPIYNSDGTLNWANATWTNPFSLLLQTYKARSNNLISNAILSYKVFKGFELKASLGYNSLQINEMALGPIASRNPVNPPFGASSFTNNSISSWIIEPQAAYQLNMAGGKIEALVGATFQQNKSEGLRLGASGYTSDALLQNIQAAPTVSIISVANAQYKYNALFGRINYNRQNKYLLNLTVRRDGSSRFGPDKQFHNFGSVGTGWIFSEENYIQKTFPVLSYGKLRASYGTTGNDQVGDYRFLDLFSNTQNSYQGVVGLTPTGLFNPDLAWEENKKLELGLELGFFKDRVLFIASYFRNRSSNELVGYPLPALTGFTFIAKNLPALVENKGWEFTLNTINIRSHDFTWSSSVNLTILRNKLVDFPNLSASPYNSLYIIGQPITITKVFHLIGVDPQTGAYQFADSKGNPISTPSPSTDKNIIINTSPKFYGGFQNSFQYKGFQLDVFFQFVKQVGINYLYLALPGYNGFNQPVSVLGRWQKPGDIAAIQKFTQTISGVYTGYSNAITSDLAYTDASFIRLKNLSLSYQLPKLWVKKLHIENARFYVQGQNLLTITHYQGMDPENQSKSALPPLRVITTGIQISL